MRISTALQAFSAAAALALLAGCSGGSAIAPTPSTPVGLLAQLKVNTNTGSREIKAVPLGSDARFAVLAGSTVTNSGPTIVTGDLGVSPGSGVTGFPPGKVFDGSIHAADGVAARAQHDLTTAYNNAAGRTNPTLLPGDIGGMTLAPGIYKASAKSLTITGNVTLDGRNDPDSVFIFQVPTKLTASVNSSVTLISRVKARNIFWQVGTSATLKKASVFKGIILAHASISLGTGATVVPGRLLARNGAVTLLRNTVTEPDSKE